MYVPDHPIHEYHTQTYCPVNEFGYKDFIPMFTAEKFNADE
jgi:alpha-L-fucosidase